MESGSAIHARAFVEADLPGVLELLQATFGDWPRLPVAVEPLEYLRWKLVDRPYATLADVVAVDGERVVGSFFRWLEPAWFNGRHTALGSGSDIAVHPEYRGQNVYSLMRDLRDELSAGPYVFQLGHTQNDIIRARQAFHGWIPVRPPMDVMARRLGRLRAVRGPGPEAGATLRDIGQFDEMTDHLFESVMPTCAFITERRSARMNWRYLDTRAGEFRVRGAYEGHGLAGYAVTRLAGRRSFLADLLVSPGRNDVGRQLVGDALRLASDAGAAVIRTWMQATHPLRPMLERAGFRRETTVDLRYRPGTMTVADGACLEHSRGWMHYMLGDTDLL